MSKPMKHPPANWCAATCAIFLCAGSLASGQLTNTPSSEPLAVSHNQLPVFHPPGISGGALPIRVGGGSRGAGSDAVTVEVLVPDAVALTTSDQPSLYWYQSKASPTRCEVTLTEPKKAKPLLVLQSTKPTEAGIHAVKLSDHKVKLEPGIVYKWSVALVPDPENRSEDVLATGIVQYEEASPELKSKLAAADESSRASVFASEGVWYDALDTLSGELERNPKDHALHDQRANLLTQVGLDGVKIEKTAIKD